MPQIAQTGDFRGRLIGWGFNESKATYKDAGGVERQSQSVGIDIQMVVLEMFNHSTNEWEDHSAYQWTARGTVWIIKKDGTPNQESIERFMKASGWTGNPDQILGSAEWEPLDFGFNVESETYDGKARYKINWINAWDYTPGGVRAMPEAQAIALKNKIGSKLRAVAGNVARNVPKPTPKPAAPAAPVAAPVDPPAAVEEAPFVPDDMKAPW